MKILTNEYKSCIFERFYQSLEETIARFLKHTMGESKDYELLLEFIETYLPIGFDEIDKTDPLLQKIHAMMIKNKQFFYFGDMLEFKIMYTSDAVKQAFGFSPSEIDPGLMFSGTHPDDLQRHSVSRAKMIKVSSDLYVTNSPFTIMSTNLRFRHAEGHYINFLVQAYAFVSTTPKLSTYCLFVNTDIDWFGPIKHGYHFYLGEDMSYFRIPDKDLILTGCVFTDREFEILDQIREGLESKQIGEKLFLSPHTVDTHRRNILKKTNFSTTNDLIIDLQERGFF